MTKPKRRKQPTERPHARLWDGSLRYADKDFTRRAPGSLISRELMAFYRDEENKATAKG